ncbi:MFS transporter [Pedobacter antarcticus]|uniref:MFS transporter n=1 Tax=Pedobacter antarcticus TaxID=34086 RepID=UPI001C56C547|nr:MFS transporter [Pedobacter antarcticus]
MKLLKTSGSTLSTLLAFAIIPLSGFAVDIYIPSLPDMAIKLNTNASAIQLTLSIYLISYGACQLLIGSVLDSWGRRIPKLTGLLCFSIASFIIAGTTSLELVYVMRAIQGIAIATVIVSNRAYFLDLFSGEKLKHYTSLFSIVWTAAPIIAPFLGGYLQTQLGWQSNFHLLGYYGVLLFILEWFFSTETLATFQPFQTKAVIAIYKSMIQTKDFIVCLMILGLSYSMLMVYNMASPFIIETVMHYSPKMTGNFALLSGVAMLLGGILSKTLIAKPFFKKVLFAFIIQFGAAGALIILTSQIANLYTLLAYIMLLHTATGFIFNNILSYCLTRFPKNGGKASGLTGGGYTIFTSAFSYALVSLVKIESQVVLGLSYGILIISTLILFVFIKSHIPAEIKA